MKKRTLRVISLLLLFGMLACSGAKQHHDVAMPDPTTYNAHFGDMDADDDGVVNWSEFSAYFDHAEQKVFGAIDLNEDQSLDHDEWHAFKRAHGLKHHE